MRKKHRINEKETEANWEKNKEQMRKKHILNEKETHNKWKRSTE